MDSLRISPSDLLPLDWVTTAEDARLADQLAGDVEVVTPLAHSNYQAERWNIAATEVAKYGIAVIGGCRYEGLTYEKYRPTRNRLKTAFQRDERPLPLFIVRG